MKRCLLMNRPCLQRRPLFSSSRKGIVLPTGLRLVGRLFAMAVLLGHSGIGWSMATISAPPSIQAAPGWIVLVPITLSNASGVINYFVDLEYPANVICLNVYPGALTADWSEPTISKSTGRCRIAGLGLIPISGTGTLFTLEMGVLPSTPNGQILPLHFRQAELNDDALPVTPLDGQIDAFRVSILSLTEHTHTYPGREITIPVRIDEGIGIQNLFFEIRYDSLVMALTAPPATSFPNGWLVSVNTSFPGKILFAALSTIPLQAGPMQLASLKFTILPNTPALTETYVELDQSEINEGAIGAVSEGGRVIIDAPAAVPIQGVTIAFVALLLPGVLLLQRPRETGGRCTHVGGDL